MPHNAFHRWPVVLAGLLLAAALLGPLAVEARAPPANPPSCASTPVHQCSFSCQAGDIISITVCGARSASGAAVCGGGSASCAGTTECSASDWAYDSDDEGFCDLTTGHLAICSAHPPPMED